MFNVYDVAALWRNKLYIDYCCFYHKVLRSERLKHGLKAKRRKGYGFCWANLCTPLSACVGHDLDMIITGDEKTRLTDGSIIAIITNSIIII